MAQELLRNSTVHANVYTAAIVGIETRLVNVEVDVHMGGLPSWSMVGLLETAVKEARDRVSSAIRNSGYKLLNRRTIVNLSPAHIKKSGAHFDLPIAIGMLMAWEVCRPQTAKRYLLAGELSLAGGLLPVSGILLLALAAREAKLDGIIVPCINEDEAKLVNIDVIALPTLADVVLFLNGEATVEPLLPPQPTPRPQMRHLDFADVQGQPIAKRALEVAASGGHHVLMVGPPGSGKTMLAERLPSILPPLTESEKLETLKMQSLHGLLDRADVLSDERPFRAPHHSASYAGLIGGGHNVPRLGEISLAHQGVLFLDELGEFRKDVLEVLRQPLEAGCVRIVRAGMSLTYPAQFMLIAAMNPCRCGYLGHPKRECRCTIPQIHSYRQKISGPLLDRIDLHLDIEPVPHAALLADRPGESSSEIRRRVMDARRLQLIRLGARIGTNARIPAHEIAKCCTLGKKPASLLKQAAERLSLSARSTHRVLKLARTIADLENSDAIGATHIAEALKYRPSDIDGRSY